MGEFRYRLGNIVLENGHFIKIPMNITVEIVKEKKEEKKEIKLDDKGWKSIADNEIEDVEGKICIVRCSLSRDKKVYVLGVKVGERIYVDKVLGGLHTHWMIKEEFIKQYGVDAYLEIAYLCGK